MTKTQDRGDTHRYICVLVENDLEEVRREYGRGFRMLLRSADVLFLSVWTRRGTGQICQSRNDLSHRFLFFIQSYIIWVTDLRCPSTPGSRPVARQTPQSRTSSPGSGYWWCRARWSQLAAEQTVHTQPKVEVLELMTSPRAYCSGLIET